MRMRRVRQQQAEEESAAFVSPALVIQQNTHVEQSSCVSVVEQQSLLKSLHGLLGLVEMVEGGCEGSQCIAVCGVDVEMGTVQLCCLAEVPRVEGGVGQREQVHLNALNLQPY